MARGHPGVVRTPLQARKRSRRTLDQRLYLRLPGLAAAGARLITKLSPDSSLRRAAVRRSYRLATEAYNRRDLEALMLGFHRDLEYYPYREFAEAGLAKPCYRGLEGYRTYVATTYEVWGAEVRLEPTELIDLGDRIVLLADMPMRELGSGVSLNEKYASVATLKDGRVVRQKDFLDHAEALQAVGLRE